MKRLVIMFCAFLFLFLGNTEKSFADVLPDRFGGKNRFEVAVSLSQKWSISDSVFIVNHTAFADALSSGPLAYKNNSPILLALPDRLTDETVREITRLAPNKVFVIGGEGSISNKVIEQLNSMGIANIERIGGKNRFEVSANIALKINQWEKVIIANGLNFPDALAISPYAATQQIPILLTIPSALPSPIATLLREKGTKQSFIIGGEASVTPQVEQNLPAPIRVGGKDRFEVAANIVKTLKTPTEKIYIATGLTFADALTGSVVAAKENASLLLTLSDYTPEPTINIFKEFPIQNYSILGGTGSVSEDAVSDIQYHKQSDNPIIYLVPHADDEVLTFGVDIINQIKNNREVYVLLLSQGEDSTAREVINGLYDEQSSHIYPLFGPVKCTWHGVYHDPHKESFLHGHLDQNEFGEIRSNDFKLASEALGVKKENIFLETLSSGEFNKSNISRIIEKYHGQFPEAEFRTMSWYDRHAPHALIGAIIKEKEEKGDIHPLKTTYFLSIYTDRFAKARVPFKIKKIQTQDNQSLLNGINVYKKYDPINGLYGSGYHSVKSQFDQLQQIPYVNIHY